jgi:hypothetical protein
VGTLAPRGEQAQRPRQVRRVLVVWGERGGSPARALATSGMQASSGLRTVASPQLLSASVSPTAPRWWGARPAWFAAARGTRPENPPPRAARTSARCGLSIGQVGDRAFSDVSGMSRIAPGHRDTSPGVLRDTRDRPRRENCPKAGELPARGSACRTAASYALGCGLHVELVRVGADDQGAKLVIRALFSEGAEGGSGAPALVDVDRWGPTMSALTAKSWRPEALRARPYGASVRPRL